MKPQTIALDGTAASGKSTLGSRLAQALDYLFLDTGLMYRAVTWAVRHNQTDVHSEEAVSVLAENLDLQITPPATDDARHATIIVDNTDITHQLHTPDVNQYVSIVSSYRRVRQCLTKRQRQIANSGPVVMVGRDIGTVVLPHADLKLFTVASPEVRARRRYQECLEMGQTVNFDELLASIIRRDKLDAEKPISPMVPADDAVILDTDRLSRDEVFAHVMTLIAAKEKEAV